MKQLICGLDEQQCQQECRHKSDREKCPFVKIQSSTPTPVLPSIEGEDPIKVIYEMLCKISHPFHTYADNEAARDMALQINHIRGYIVHEVLPITNSDKK